MSLDINELVRLVKRAAVEAVQAGAPMSGGYGYVTSTSPLEITVDQKKILTEAQLILTDAVRDYTVEMTTMPEYHETEETSGGAGDAAFAPHKHRYQGRKKWKSTTPSRWGKRSSSCGVTAGSSTLSWADGRRGPNGNFTDHGG